MKSERKFYKKVEYHRKIGAAVASTLLVLGIASTAVYPESHSKYWDDKPEVLSYGGTLHPTYKEDLDLYVLGNNPPPPDIHDENYQSNFEEVYFKFSFDRNDAVQEDVVDKYSIIVPKTACSIVNINGTETSSGEIVSNGKVDVTKYNNYRVTYDTTSNDTTTVIMKCDVDKITDKKTNKLNVSVQIKETIGDGPQFLYQEGTFTRTLSEYYKNYPLPYTGLEWTDDYLILPEDLLTRDPNFLSNLLKDPSDTAQKLRDYLPDDFNYNQSVNDLYEVFLEIWLKSVIGNSNNYKGYKPGNSASVPELEITSILNYITGGGYIDNNSIQIDQSLPGFRVNIYNSYDQMTNTFKNIYKYEVIDNFMGYIMTDISMKASLNTMHFSSQDSSVLQEAFEYYIINYIYPSENINVIHENAQLIMDYVNTFSNRGISYLMEKDENGNLKNSIPGMIYEERNATNGKGSILRFEPLLYSYAYNKVNQVIQIPYYSLATYMRMIYRQGLIDIYGDIISTDLFNKITDSTSDVRKSVLKTKEAFNDYFVYYDKVDETNEENNKYVLINVYSDGMAYNYVDIKILSFERTSNTTISITIDPKEYEKQDENIRDTLLEVIKSLDKQFGKTEHDGWEANTGDPPVANPIIGDSYIKIEYDKNNPNVIENVTYIADVPLLNGTPPSGDELGAEDEVLSPIPEVPIEDNQGNKEEEVMDLPIVDNKTGADMTTPNEDETVPPTNEVEKTEEVDENTSNSDSNGILNNKENTKDDALNLETENNPISKPESNTDSNVKLKDTEVSNKLIETESAQVLGTTSTVDIGAPPSGGDTIISDIGIEGVPSGLTNTINNTGPGLTG